MRVGKVKGKHKVGKHFIITITDTSLTITRDQASIDAEAALDGIYVIRTTATADELDPPGSSTPTRNCPTWNVAGATSRSTTSTYAPSTTGSKSGSKPTCSSACSPSTSAGTCAKPSPR
jgi:hypothetical protein